MYFDHCYTYFNKRQWWKIIIIVINYMEELSQEINRSSDIEGLYKDLKLLQEIVNDLNIIILNQGDDIDKICKNVENVNIKTQQSEKLLVESNKYQSSTSKIKIIASIVTVVSTYLGIKLVL